MKKSLKNAAIVAIAVSTLGVAGQAEAFTYTVDQSATWLGFMNVFDLPSNGGAYQFGSAWGTADLTATWSSPSSLTLGTNNINDPNPYWYVGGGAPGAQGNKIMDANMYVQVADGSLSNQTVTFTGNVVANTLFGQTDSLGNAWTSVAFIKEFTSDFSSFTQTTIPLTTGTFSISKAISSNATNIVQYGFQTIGSNVWITDAAAKGNIQIQAVPEPTTMLALGAGLAFLRRRKSTR
ncbi:MAG: PEP-CTERM sorting domain-containing protein [Fimbriimonas sp.]|jgi:hypothetical protein|nr:PEP-CTERM sorting domain-containing protein [Fimbriimonas sp.]